MSSSEGAEAAGSDMLAAQIASLGEQIKVAKAEKKPKEEWDPLLKEMLALKAQYKEQTGQDYAPTATAAAAAPTAKAAVAAASETSAAEKDGQDQEEGNNEKNKAKREAKAAAKAAKEAEKERKRQERLDRERAKQERLAAASVADNFGDMALVQSQEITSKCWTKVEHLSPIMAGKEVLVRGHLQTVRSVGKGAFVLVRSSLYSVQGVAFEQQRQNSVVSQAMIKYMAALPVESIVDMKGIVTVPTEPIQAATQKDIEIQITAFHCVSKAKAALPFVLEDACRPDTVKETDVGEYNEDDAEVVAAAAASTTSSTDVVITVGQKIRHDYRWIDLRTPANQSIFRIESMVGCLFREFLMSRGFIEIHTPKIIGGASEGGSDVFTLDYFGQPACLAMSPQLHKQMTAACSGFERVFETGPVFRAENSNTRRHLCEFTGLDLEMVIQEHYYEVLDVFSDLFIYIFDGINERCRPELERIREQHPFEDLQYLKPTLRLSFAEGCEILREAGIAQGEYEDLSTENEKKLGDLVKAKYGTDFFFMDKYPLAVRPFYTMPDPHNPQLSNSYDFFLRGQEILSGAQRIHDPDMLQERAISHGISVHDIQAYVDSFRYGALPHGGGGIGLERTVMLFLGLPNIRKAAWFPRDPKRLAP